MYEFYVKYVILNKKNYHFTKNHVWKRTENSSSQIGAESRY